MSPDEEGRETDTPEGPEISTSETLPPELQWDPSRLAQCLEIGGWLMPKGEVHLVDMMKPGAKRAGTVKGRWHYQHHKYEMVLEEMAKRGMQHRVAIDIGAHIGLWSWHMVDDFQTVEAFEPIPLHQFCYEYNMSPEHNWVLHKQGLSDAASVVDFHVPSDTTGDAHIATPRKMSHLGKAGIDTIKDVYIGYLDQFDFQNVDFIKIDVEGHELEVVKGATETINRCRPALLIEQKGNDERFYGQKRDAALNYLIKLGMESVRVWSGDHVVMFPE